MSRFLYNEYPQRGFVSRAAGAGGTDQGQEALRLDAGAVDDRVAGVAPKDEVQRCVGQLGAPT